MNKKLSILLIVSALVAVLLAPLSAAGARAVYPEVIPLRDGFQPEGIAAGEGHTFYTGSLNGGAIFRGDARSGEVEMIAPPGERMAVGMDYDRRSGYLFVAGGATGAAFIFDGGSGDLVDTYQLIAPGATFVNDVIVTSQAAYFTDSFQSQFYRLPLGPEGALPDASQVETIALGGDFAFTPGEFNANGIVASQDGQQLIVVNSFTGLLYRVDPTSGAASEIDLGGAAVPSGDGLVLRGHTLYVVQNALNQIAVIRLKGKFSLGKIKEHLTSPHFRVPTTAAAIGDALYAVNARFDEVPPGQPAPDDTFEAVRVPIH